jgi:2-keto-4-pentenoate hydratase/2-oxohepta-3-ene-1,7-dioic acid hydratase in catechol pathway
MIFLSVVQNSGGGRDGNRRTGLLIPQLQAVERRVAPVLAQELVVTPRFRHGSILDDEDAMGVDHGVQAIRNHDGRSPAAKTLDRALDCIYGYGVGIDLTRRDLQIASRDMKRPWEVGKAFDASAPCGPLQPASKIGHPSKGRIALKANGKVRQDGDLAQMIWNVPEVIVKLSEMVELAAGDIIMTGTPSGVAATVAGDKLECEIEGVGKLTVTIGPPAK